MFLTYGEIVLSARQRVKGNLFIFLVPGISGVTCGFDALFFGECFSSGLPTKGTEGNGMRVVDFFFEWFHRKNILSG